jgi:hypothetical protein
LAEPWNPYRFDAKRLGSLLTAVPEVDAFGGLAAVLGSIAALIWERRRRK